MMIMYSYSHNAYYILVTLYELVGECNGKMFLVAIQCFQFVKVSKDSFFRPFFKKKEAVVSNGTKANPYVILSEQL